MVRLIDDFRSKSQKRSEEAKLRRQFMKQRHDEQKRRDEIDDAETSELAMAIEAVIASSIQVAQFRAKLDGYDEATVHALMLNQEQLDAVTAKMAALLSRAYVMPDGRRVFRTEDGARVFDEHGQEVSPAELDFDLITPDKPTWEQFQPLLTEKHRLEAEQAKLHEFQSRLDDARKRIDAGDLTEQELKDLDEDLDAAMPPSARAFVGNYPKVPTVRESDPPGAPPPNGRITPQQNAEAKRTDFTPT